MNLKYCLRLQHMSGMLEMSGSHGGTLKTLIRSLRKTEAKCALAWQQRQFLEGDVEADATSLRKWKSREGPLFCF